MTTAAGQDRLITFLSQQAGEAEGSPPGRRRGGDQSSPDNGRAGWYCQRTRVCLADGKVYVRNQRVMPVKRYAASILVDMGWGAVHTRRWRATPVLVKVAGREATRDGCGVLVVMPQGAKWGTDPVDRCAVNVGSVPDETRLPTVRSLGSRLLSFQGSPAHRVPCRGGPSGPARWR